MITLLNKDGIIIDEIDCNINSLKGGIFDKSEALRALDKLDIGYDKIKISKNRVNSENFLSVFGEYKGGILYGRTDIYGFYETKNENQIDFYFSFEDFYIKSYHINNDFIEIDFRSNWKLDSNLDKIGNLKQILREKKLNDLF